MQAEGAAVMQEQEATSTARAPIDLNLLRAAVWLPEEPGPRSDFDLAPEIRAELPPTRRLRPAAVLCAVKPAPEGFAVILTRRAAHLNAHAGQIAFPGGKVDLEDRSPLATALREAEEEIGLTPDLVDVLGPIERYETVTGFIVTPFIAVASASFQPIADHNEVADVFEAPLDFVLAPENIQRVTREIDGRQRPFFAIPWRDKYIWGATAAMLRALADRVARARMR